MMSCVAMAVTSGVDGVAIRFVSFAKDGAEQIQSYLESLTTEPEPDLLTEIEPESPDPPQPATEATPPTQRVRKRKNPNDPVILEFE